MCTAQVQGQARMFMPASKYAPVLYECPREDISRVLSFRPNKMKQPITVSSRCSTVLASLLLSISADAHCLMAITFKGRPCAKQQLVVLYMQV